MTNRTKSKIREFVTCNDDGERVDWTDASEDTVHVGEVHHGLYAVDVDEDDVECDERDRNRTINADAILPVFCMRSPRKKTPPFASPQECVTGRVRAQTLAGKNAEGLHIGETILLCGEEFTIQ